MSSVPTGRVVPSMWAIFAARRCARLTPRVRSPTNARSLAPPFFSRISWAMRVRARWSAVSSRTCAFSRWRGAGLLIFSPCGPLRARLKESSGTDCSHSTWPASLVSTRRGAGRALRAPALDGPALVLHADAARLHDQAPRRLGRHDLFQPVAVPHDQIGATPDGAAVVAEIEHARRVGRDGPDELTHQVLCAHVGGDRGDERQVSGVGGAHPRGPSPDIVPRPRGRDTGLPQPADGRQNPTDVSLVRPSPQGEIR